LGSKKAQSSFYSRGFAKLRGRALLRRLLSERNQYPERAAEIDRMIRDAFARTAAVLVMDMVGFSRLTFEYGIIHYLAMIHQMQEAARPAVVDNGGRIIKLDADNVFAIFEKPEHALESALDIFRAFDAVNTVVPAERDIYGSIGIGYGETLVIGGRDLFGSEMNLASKLGEDFASKGEILLTPAAFEALPAGRYAFSPAPFTIGEIRVDCYRYQRSVLSNGNARPIGITS
jgi:adenylate cyclase